MRGTRIVTAADIDGEAPQRWNARRHLIALVEATRRKDEDRIVFVPYENKDIAANRKTGEARVVQADENFDDARIEIEKAEEIGAQIDEITSDSSGQPCAAVSSMTM